MGNVTGSNSVNVFLGLGMPWTIGAIYWAGGSNEDWRRRFGDDDDIPSRFREGAFIVKAGDLAFSVTVFSVPWRVVKRTVRCRQHPKWPGRVMTRSKKT